MARAIRAGIRFFALALCAPPGVGAAAEVSFGWTGTVAAIHPALAASLPANSGIRVGAPVWGIYTFESTTPDADPRPTQGSYPGALVGWRIRVGLYSFEHAAAAINGIDVVREANLAFYEAVDGVTATPPLPAAAVLEADIFLLSLAPSAVTSDHLPLSPPDLRAWDVTSAGIFRPGSGTPLIDVELTALCAGPCEPEPTDRDGDGIADALDSCPFHATPDRTDTDADGRGDACECGDQNGDGRNTVSDLVAINAAIFNPALAMPLCDANNDGLCTVSDIVAVNAEIFSPTNTSTCARQPVPGPEPGP